MNTILHCCFDDTRVLSTECAIITADNELYYKNSW